MVADGVGGRAHGEIASAVAVDAMAHYALAVMPWMLSAEAASEQDLQHGIERALTESQDRMKRVAQRQGLDARMSTTLTMAYVAWPYLYVAHAGDSRLYLQRGGKLVRLTHDHA
jgi:protein phosphatase